MTNEEIQAILESTFNRLAFFCRDLDLDENLVAKYQPNQILMERAPIHVAYKIRGLAKNCRYLIASSKAYDPSPMLLQPQEYAHAVIPSGAFFKVLNIHKENGKTQILLLHIPEEGVPLFASSKINIEDLIIEKGKERFKKAISSKPLEELQSDYYLDETTAFPIGMSKKGKFFLEEKINTISNEVETKTKPKKETTSNEVKSKEHNTENNKEVETKAENPKKKKKGFWSRLFGK